MILRPHLLRRIDTSAVHSVIVIVQCLEFISRNGQTTQYLCCWLSLRAPCANTLKSSFVVFAVVDLPLLHHFSLPQLPLSKLAGRQSGYTMPGDSQYGDGVFRRGRPAGDLAFSYCAG